MHNPPSATQGHPQSGLFDDPIYAVPPPDEPPPSYDDATHSSSSPLLVGPPPDYGAFRAYVDPDESSEASSEADIPDNTLEERLGQVFGVLVVLAIMYAFWKIINQPSVGQYPG